MEATTYYKNRMKYLCEKFGNGLEIEANGTPTGPGFSDYHGRGARTLEELWQEQQAEQERLYQESFASRTKFRGKRFGLELLIRR